MKTTTIAQRQTPAVAFRTKRKDMEKIMVVSVPEHWLSARIETCARDIGIHIEPLNAPNVATAVVKAGQIIMWIVFIGAVLPPTLLPVVEGARDIARCMSEWGDGANASLGYAINVMRGNKSRTLCMRYLLTAVNTLPCEKYAIPVHASGREVVLKHQLALREQTVDRWITEDYPPLTIHFSQNRIFFLWGGNDTAPRYHIYRAFKSEFRNIFEPYSPPPSELTSTNLCAAQAAQAERSLAGYTTIVAANAFYTTTATFTTAAATFTTAAATVRQIATSVGQIATSFMTSALSDHTGIPTTNASMNTAEQEERSGCFSYTMIAIGALGVLALSGPAYILFHAIKKRSQASDCPPAPEAMPLKNIQGGRTHEP